MVTECIGGGGGGVAHVSSSDRQEYVIYSWMTRDGHGLIKFNLTSENQKTVIQEHSCKRRGRKTDHGIRPT